MLNVLIIKNVFLSNSANISKDSSFNNFSNESFDIFSLKKYIYIYNYNR